MARIVALIAVLLCSVFVISRASIDLNNGLLISELVRPQDLTQVHGNHRCHSIDETGRAISLARALVHVYYESDSPNGVAPIGLPHVGTKEHTIESFTKLLDESAAKAGNKRLKAYVMSRCETGAPIGLASASADDVCEENLNVLTNTLEELLMARGVSVTLGLKVLCDSPADLKKNAYKGSERRLLSVSDYGNSTQSRTHPIILTSPIITGILVAFLLIGIFFIGFCAMFALQTPAKFEGGLGRTEAQLS
eukprot:CAMPEP_0184669372 /NCGR_PEP_ID=MMETSP0308-20130426/77024_1 /TAXON_ID=38269 /ORGANISM="Gloeochaete witrockiana, Strain SAG 46.84" /LENGTH=250 /DNA_ID=CAMNT_0027115589 /DNA_START=17 /DNA_END=769 /DNA_ORIENTATION=-